MKEYKILHLCSGVGGGTYGFEQAVGEWKGLKGKFRTLAAIDSDLKACEDHEYITGSKAVCMDLFERRDYIDFHGHEPPPEWKEATPEDILAACGGEYPDVIFMSPPCKGNSGLLPQASAATAKYQALNRLATRCIFLCLEAFKDNLPSVILLENVPRIRTRSKGLLHTIKGMLNSYRYAVDDRDHDCGELGGLAQHRKRYLLMARNQDKMDSFVYLPTKQRVRSIGEVIGPLPMPDDPRGGPMHHHPRLQWKTSVRLALIREGGDWRDLENIKPEQYRLEYVPRGGGSFGVQEWDKPSHTITGNSKANGSTAASIADPRLTERKGRHPGVYRVVRFNDPAPCVTETRFGSGAIAISDPRTGFKDSAHHNIYKVSEWDKEAATVTGAHRPNNGAISIADPRMNCSPRSGMMGVQKWDEPGKTVIGAGDIHAGVSAVADPRIPKDNESGVWIIISLDNTWHRPLTTWESAALQGFPLVINGKPLKLAGNSDARWREAIGNAVPPPAARAIAEVVLHALLVASENAWEMSSNEIWVSPKKSWEEIRTEVVS